MKKASRILALLLALVLTLGLSVTAFAEEATTPNNGTITINNAVSGQTYTIYKILDLESYNETDKAYAYKATAEWKAFLESATTYVKVDEQDYVTWVAGADAAEFAKLAQAYAAEKKLVGEGTKKAGSTTVAFDNLPLGYYLVDSTLGTLCSLNTTKPNVTINEKNAEPTNEKTVEEDSTGNYGKTNDADIGQTVNFKSTITAQPGAQNYVFHDKMSEGLTYIGVTSVTLNNNTVDTEYYKVKTTGLKDTDCTFEVEFTQDFCDGLKADDQIVISYTATLNENAVIGSDGNPNQSWINYGEEGKFESTPSETKTYTWSFDVFKYHVVGEEKKALAGAKFTLSKDENGTTPITLVKVEDKEGNVYRVAKTGETGVTEITTDATGRFTIEGLDSDTYYLTETAAPSGYNKLAKALKVVIGEKGALTVDGSAANEVEVENKSGTELPSTGGMGTTIFYVLGGILAVGAVILLVTKKRVERS